MLIATEKQFDPLLFFPTSRHQQCPSYNRPQLLVSFTYQVPAMCNYNLLSNKSFFSLYLPTTPFHPRSHCRLPFVYFDYQNTVNTVGSLRL